jgi:uncharacterized protein (DUF305 family)
MVTVSKTALAVVLAGGLVACGAASDNQANQSAENATENAAAAATGPVADAEKRMNEALMAAVGTDAGDSWAKKMVVHHQGAIDMSEIVLQQNPRADVADMARMTIEKQRKEIEDIRKLFKTGSPNQQSADLYGEAMMNMHQSMQAATGADVSETFLRKMLDHHKGAVAMSDIALQNGVTGRLRERVQKTRDDQQKEVRMVEAMLRGETMQHAMHESGFKSAEQAKAEPALAEKAQAEPKGASKPPATKPNAPPAADAKKEAPTTDPNCTAEHREMGHC